MEPQEQLEIIEDHVSPSASSPSRSGSPKPRKKKKMKRTRDLPNLTQCHSCGFRIDSCSGNDSLEILYSEWRIVLLCETCFVGVESSSLCSYCFKSGSSDDSFSCRQCKHIVHKSCFSSHADVAPWSFCCSSTDAAGRFSVCLDCWVPKLVADKRVNCSGKRKNPLVFDLGNCRKRLLDNVVMDSNFDGQSKGGAAGTRGRGLAVKKALGARRASVSDGELAMPNGSVEILKDFGSENSNSLATANGSCRMLEVSPAETPVTVDGNNGKDCEMKVSLKDMKGVRSNGMIYYARRNYRNGRPDRWRIKYTRRALVNAKTNQYLMKYARKTPTNQRYNEMLKRFGITYARRKLHQCPISV